MLYEVITVFDTKNNEYWVEVLEGNEYEVSTDPFLRKKKITGNVFLKDVITERTLGKKQSDNLEDHEYIRITSYNVCYTKLLRIGSLSERYVTQIVPLKNIKAQDVANALKPLISREGDIVVYEPLNTIIIIETKTNLNKILTILDNIDKEKEIVFVKIYNSSYNFV